MDDLFLLLVWVAAVCLSLMVGYVMVAVFDFFKRRGAK